MIIVNVCSHKKFKLIAAASLYRSYLSMRVLLSFNYFLDCCHYSSNDARHAIFWYHFQHDRTLKMHMCWPVRPSAFGCRCHGADDWCFFIFCFCWMEDREFALILCLNWPQNVWARTTSDLAFLILLLDVQDKRLIVGLERVGSFA